MKTLDPNPMAPPTFPEQYGNLPTGMYIQATELLLDMDYGITSLKNCCIQLSDFPFVPASSLAASINPSASRQAGQSTP